MSGLEVVPFEAEHIPAAANLRANVHGAHRHFEACLPEKVDFEGEVAKEFENASGSIGFASGEIVGYLIGKRSENALGPHIWSGVAGHAAKAPTFMFDLYAKAAAGWVDQGLTRHFVFVPPAPSLLDPWLRMSFALSGALALRETAGTEKDRVPPNVRVRPSTPEDLPDVARLAAVLDSELNAPPSFGGMPLLSDEQYREAWCDIWADETRVHFVAERAGRVVGHILLYKRPPGDLRTPDNSIDLSIAATDPDARGSGVGVAMTSHALAWAREAGYTTMTTDWRISNLIASRFWPRRGFRVTFQRLYRSIP